ncbi:MAG TPA: M1 family metallopeptidase [Gemmatimonadales bacterium]|nr:M1 family metallopeptidase [Gemmatimonadales bacterium]
MMRGLPGRSALLAVALFAAIAPMNAQRREYTRADSLRGGLDTPGRNWWDVTYYDLEIAVSLADSSIAGRNAISYMVRGAGAELQIDLMTPLVLDSVVQDGRQLSVRTDGNAHFAAVASQQAAGTEHTVTAYYHGRPRIAPRPPWDGGFTWGLDSLGRTWVVTTDQGVGASIWWPNKDTQADEPDSQRVAIRVPDPLMQVGPGRLRSKTPHADGTTTWEWFVTNPINNYAIALAIGNYAHWSERYPGEAGWLTMDYYPLDFHLETARKQWLQARTTMQCFEWWYGPYPFYEDGYKLIEVSNNGMEHQSAVSYGNGFANGYRGRDGSGTGLGMLFDFIIVHESAHEWWGNNITTRDLADMWVHESFANYSEGLYVECLFGKDAGAEYIRGTRQGIGNRQPIVPPARGVNAQGSGDMYPKGGNMLHTIRQIIDDDALWRDILRGLQRTYRHAIVDGSDVQNYISRRAGIDLSRVFDQYLTRTGIPVLEYRWEGNRLSYRWSGVGEGFDMPIDVTTAPGKVERITPTTAWQVLDVIDRAAFAVDPDWYVNVNEVTGS